MQLVRQVQNHCKLPSLNYFFSNLQIHVFVFIIIPYIVTATAFPPKDENGFYHIDDMNLTREQLTRFYGFPGFRFRSGRKESHYKWKDGIVPYEIDSTSDYDHKHYQRIKRSVKKFNNIMKGCLNIR